MARDNFYIFLDIDGVIATKRALRDHWLSYTAGHVDIDKHSPSELEKVKLAFPRTSMFNWPFDQKAINNYHKLQVFLSYELNLEPVTVICSSWRKFFEPKELLEVFWYKKLNIHKLEGFTGDLSTRGEEIQQYVNKKIMGDNYIVIDDECSYDIFPTIDKEHCVETRFRLGFGAYNKYNEAVRKIKQIVL